MLSPFPLACVRPHQNRSLPILTVSFLVPIVPPTAVLASIRESLSSGVEYAEDTLSSILATLTGTTNAVKDATVDTAIGSKNYGVSLFFL